MRRSSCLSRAGTGAAGASSSSAVHSAPPDRGSACQRGARARESERARERGGEGERERGREGARERGSEEGRRERQDQSVA
eukprot:268120-Rhodomonas_salina.1